MSKLTPQDRRKLADLDRSATRVAPHLSLPPEELEAARADVEAGKGLDARLVPGEDEKADLSNGVHVVLTYRNGTRILSASRREGRLGERWFREICSALCFSTPPIHDSATGIRYCVEPIALDS